jgi:hypothetical protein
MQRFCTTGLQCCARMIRVGAVYLLEETYFCFHLLAGAAAGARARLVGWSVRSVVRQVIGTEAIYIYLYLYLYYI